MKYKVESSVISMVNLKSDGKMVITFKNGDKYEYSDVPKKIVEEFVYSDSIGKYFNSNIRGKYDERRIS